MLNLYKDKIEDAFESFKKSWLITEKMTNKWNKKQIEMLKIDILNNIGSIHLQKSNFEKTDEYFKLADKKIIDYN